ncbi:MAG: hypothetical protein ACR2PT_18105 [Endozoicomonas sp.]
MKIFHFSLVLTEVGVTTPGLEDALFEVGCDDALVCFYNQSAYLVFDREAESLREAVASAVADVESSSCGARVVSVDAGDLVGLSDIAELSGLTRQAVALLKDGKRGGGQFPAPVLRLEGRQPLWKWSQVAQWLVEQGRVGAELAENALVVDEFNQALELRNSGRMESILSLVESIAR